MKTILWKELRENYKWGLLALVVMLLATFYALSQSDERQDYQNNITLCHATFLIVTAFGFSLVGGALAGVQILPELKRDQWAALLHRPLPRWQILLGKALVGLGLYAVATLVPLAACISYAATPGHFAAPFTLSLALPALSDWCMGLAVYTLTLLMCLHGGRWWGSRGALALAGILVFVLHLQPRWPFSLPLLACVLFLLAACGAILSPRLWRGRPPILRWAGILSVFLGAYGLLALAVGGKLAFGSSNVTYSMGITGFVIAQDGTLLYAKIDLDSKHNTVTDMEGRDVSAQYLADGGSGFNYLYPFTYYVPGQKRADRHPSVFTRNSYQYIQRVYLRADERENWYYLPAQRYFVGYDNTTRQSLGFCDREGFKQEPAAIVPFAENFSLMDMGRSPDSITVRSGPEIVKVNFSERSLKPLFRVGDAEVIGYSDFSADYEKVAFSVIALLDRLILLDAEGREIWSKPYERSLDQWGGIGISTNQAEDRLYVQYQDMRPGQTSLPTYVYVYDREGKLLATYDHDVTRTKPIVSWARTGLVIISPPAILFGVQARSLFDPKVSFYGPFPTPKIDWKELGLLTLGTLLLGGLTFAIARKQGRPLRESLVWAGFVLLLGLPGLLTFRLASDWPVRLRCPHCGKPRSSDDRPCRACQGDWPQPERSGAELLEPLGVGR